MSSYFGNRQTIIQSICAAVAIVTATILAIMAPIYAAIVLTIIVVLVALPYPIFFVATTGVTLPLAASVAIMSPIGIIPACDIAAMIAILSYWMSQAHQRSQDQSILNHLLLPPLRTPLLFATPYFAVAISSVIFNDGSLATTVQRLEIIIVWAFFGVLLYKTQTFKVFSTWFVAACIGLSLAWIASPGVGGVLGVQKNPSGGVISAAIIVLLLSPMRNTWRLPGIAILCAGLLSTGSRGSMLGLAAAVLLLLFFVQQWKRVLVPFVVAVLSSAVILAALPQAVTARLFAQDDAGLYTVDIRGAFLADAVAKFRDAPWVGVGVGNYAQTDPALLSVATKDPHNVLALSLAEGGYPLLGGFLVLCAASLLWLSGKPKSTLVILALATQVSTLVHALVDVYWVRGTPAIGWILIGAACSQVYSANKGIRQLPIKYPSLPSPP